jgi:MFS family permease
VLLLLALIPFFLTSPLWAMVAIVALNGVRIFMSNFGNPAWTAIVADIIPQAMRGRYISNRNFAMGAATLLITPLAGWLIKIGAGWSSSKVIGYQIAFFLAFIVGMISTWAFSRIQEPVVAKPSAEKQRRGGLFSQLRQNPAFAGFVISAFVWNLSLQIAGPFFNVYMKNNLGGSEFQVGLAASISSISSILGQLFWGRLLDRKGALWLQTLTGFSITILPTLWIFYTAPEQVFINNSLGGALWAGYNLANFNLLLSLTPDHDRPRAVALYQTAVFTSSVIGPLIGGYVADAIDFKLIFVMSGAGRFIAMVIFLLMSVLRRKSQLVIS